MSAQQHTRLDIDLTDESIAKKRKRPRTSVVDLTSSSPIRAQVIGSTSASTNTGDSSVVITGHVLPPDYSTHSPTPGPSAEHPKNSLFSANSSEASNTPSPSPEPVIAPPSPPKGSAQEPLEEYNCPICFCSPTNPCLTPCGHVMCGECLFSAVKANLKRSGQVYVGPRGNASNPPRCPMCRSVLKGWDGRGAGIIPLLEAKGPPIQELAN